MKILGILGSPHPKGNTAILLDAVLEGAAAAGAEVERLFLGDLEMKFCGGCTQCYRLGDCRYEDDIEKVKEKMLAADGIVLGSPVYIWGVTAQMKTLMDRCAYFIHCFLLEGTYGASVATAGGGYEMETAEFQNRFLQSCGARTVGSVGALAAGLRALRDQEAAVDRAQNLGADLVAAITERRPYPEQEPAHEHLFAIMKNLVSATADNYPAQYAHWKRMGWL